MGPRTSLSGELPIDSYFSFSSKTAGTFGNKEKRSLKRKTEADAPDDAFSSTKKQRTKRPSEGTVLDSQERICSEADEPRVKAVPKAFVTTSLPTPTSLAKPPRSTLARVPRDRRVIANTSSSPVRETPFDPGNTGRLARNTASGSGLQTPQVVCYEDKKNTWTDAAARLPTGSTASRSVRKSGLAISSSLLPPPLTPSRSKAKRDYVTLACRTTPQSQRIVPSSQWSDDDQPRPESASSLEANRDQFMHPAEESDSCPDTLTLPPLSDVSLPPSSTSSLTPVKHRAPSLRTVIRSNKEYSPKTNLHACNSAYMKTSPLSLSCSRTVSLLSSDPADRGQNSQIVPTSQFDEVDLKAPSQSLLFICPTIPPQTNRCDMARSVERSQAESLSLQDQSSHSEAIVEQQPSSKDYKLSDPPSPLTPLSSSSPQPSDVMYGETVIVAADSSPPRRTLHKTLDSPTPCSPLDSVADLESGGMSQPLAEVDIPAEGPTSDEEEIFMVRPSPVRRRPPLANVKDKASPASDDPSASTPHLRISHAKLRSLPNAAVELDSDGELPFDFSVPATSQGTSMSCSASSYLDLVGTLPSAVGDFLDMIDSDASSNV